MTKATPTFRSVCPYCNCEIRSDRLQKHIRKHHPPDSVAQAALVQSDGQTRPKKFQPDLDCIERVAARTGMDRDRVLRFFEYVEVEWLRQQPDILELLHYRVIEKALLACFDGGQSSVTAQELARALARTTRYRQNRKRSTSVYAISIPMGGDPEYKLRNNRG